MACASGACTWPCWFWFCMAETALAASLRLKANTGLAARVIRVARVNAFIGRDLVGRDGLGNEGFD
ncbi:hypothetical protein D3C85_1541750 [compost metagenome]